MNRFSREAMFVIWDDDSGDCVEVGLDRDGLGMIELRYKEDSGKTTRSMLLETSRAQLVAEAIIEMVRYIIDNEVTP